MSTGVALAQEASTVQQDIERNKNISRSFWDGRSEIISTEALLRDPAFRAALGLSDASYQEILSSMRNASVNLSDCPEYREAYKESYDLAKALWGGEPTSNLMMTTQEFEERKRAVGPEAMKRLEELRTKLKSIEQELAVDGSRRSTFALETVLSPELKQKIQEAQLAAMGETAMIVPRLYEALNLTDAQKEGMERIKKELEPELEKHLEIYANNAVKIVDRVNAALPRIQESREPLGDAMRKLEAEPEHRKLLDESYASSKAFAALFKSRMSEILTEGQRKRLQELTDNPPLHALALIQRLRREQWGLYEPKEGERTDAGTDAGKDTWTPGPDSWQPGDPIPGETTPAPTRSPFPRTEN
jgi:hypothetical protein